MSAPFTPPFPPDGGGNPIVTTIFANAAGSDDTGDGTAGNPYRTFQRAIRDVPHVIPPGFQYTVDLTDLGVEVLPAGFQLPEIHSPTLLYSGSTTNGPTPFNTQAPLNIRATPRPNSGFPAADMTITGTDIASLVADPDTGLVTLTLTAPRPSWGVDLLKGLLLVSNYNITANVPIYGNTPSTLQLAGAAFPLPVGTQNLVISELSAVLQTSLVPPPPNPNFAQFWGMISFDISGGLAWQGIKFTNALGGTGTVALLLQNISNPVFELCDIEGLEVLNVSASTNILSSVIRKTLATESSSFFSNRVLYLNLGSFGAAYNLSVGFLRNVFDAPLVPIAPIATASGLAGRGGVAWDFRNCLIRNSSGAGVVANGAVFCRTVGSWSFLLTKIQGSAGDGIKAEGQVALTLQRVTGGTGAVGDPANAGVGIRINDGVSARVIDDLTLITGVGGDMKVGTLPVRTWVNFRTLDPIKNEYDLTTPFELNVASGLFTPAGETTTGAGTGGRSGSRLFQRP